MNWQEFITIWQESAKPPAPIFFRLYHDEQGHPLFYSMEDLPGLYIAIDASTFHRSPSKVRVIDGKLVEQQFSAPVSKLVPSNKGMPCDPRDVTVVVDESREHVKWSMSHES